MDERINKFLSAAGVCSRREADVLVQRGRVSVNGRAAELGTRVSGGDVVCVDGKRIAGAQKRVLLMLHKPRGIECTTAKVKGNIVDFVGYPQRIYPVGRLDRDSRGLILLTNQGELVNQMLRARYRHEKEYVVTVDRDIRKDFLAGMRSGVPVLDTVTRRCEVWEVGKRTFHIVLTQGLNRQIRRMCAYFGYEVRDLCRIRILNLVLGDLPEGQWREVTEEEYGELLRSMAPDPGTESGGK